MHRKKGEGSQMYGYTISVLRRHCINYYYKCLTQAFTWYIVVRYHRKGYGKNNIYYIRARGSLGMASCNHSLKPHAICTWTYRREPSPRFVLSIAQTTS